MLLSWEKAAALGGRSSPAWEPAGQGQARRAQMCSQSLPTAGSSPEAGALNGSFQSLPRCPSSLCPAAKPEPPLCSLLKNQSFWDEFRASEQCQPGRGRDVRVHYSTGMRAQPQAKLSTLPYCIVRGCPLPESQCHLPCTAGGTPNCSPWPGTPSAPSSQAWHRLLGGTGTPWRKDWDCRAGWRGKGPIPKTRIALIISQHWEGER